MRRHVMTYRSSDISDMFIVMRRQGKNWPSWKEWQDKEGNITTLQRQSQSHLRHWLQFWQLRPSIHDNLCYLTIKSDTGQHSQFLQCFHVSGLKTVQTVWELSGQFQNCPIRSWEMSPSGKKKFRGNHCHLKIFRFLGLCGSTNPPNLHFCCFVVFSIELLVDFRSWSF